MRNIDIRSQSRFQDTHARFGLDLFPIYKQRNFAHLLNSLIHRISAKGRKSPLWAEIILRVLYHTIGGASTVFSSYFLQRTVHFV